MTEGGRERIVQHRCPHVEEGLHRCPVPAHLLFPVHPFGDDLVDRTLHESGRDRLAAPVPGGVMDQRSLVSLEVARQFAGMVLQALDASHTTYIGTLCPAAERREFAPASLPAPMPQAPFRVLQSTNCLGGQLRAGPAKAARRLQRVLEPHGDMPPIKHDRGVRLSRGIYISES